MCDLARGATRPVVDPDLQLRGRGAFEGLV